MTIRNTLLKHASIALLAMSAAACGVGNQNDHIVGSSACRFRVPSYLQQINVNLPIPGLDRSTSSAYLRVDERASQQAPPLLVLDKSSDFRFIASCETRPEIKVVDALRDQGISLAAIEPGWVKSEVGTNFYRLHGGGYTSSWVLLDFDPRSNPVPPDEAKIVANCHEMSASANVPFLCVHSDRRGDLNIEYRFGPAEIASVDAIDSVLFALLKRE